MAGTLRAGDRIDVIATTEATEGPSSTRVLADATIRRINSSGGDSLGESRSQTITVAVDDAEDAEALVTAARAATVTVLRVTGTDGEDAPGGVGRAEAEDDPEAGTPRAATPSSSASPTSTTAAAGAGG